MTDHNSAAAQSEALGIKQHYDTFIKVDLRRNAMAEARACLDAALAAAVAAGALPEAEPPAYVVEVPGDTAHGELAANLALVGARAFRLPPRKIAEALVAHFPQNEAFDRIEVAGPGFINFYLSAEWFSSVVKAAVACGEDYGRTDAGRGEKVNVEFVSANPTGPMHLGNARGGALGDVLAEALAWAGYEVTREFYINDAGNQIVKFGKSLAARYRQLVLGEEAAAFPEDGYQGEDIRARAAEFLEQNGPSLVDAPEGELEDLLVAFALPRNVQALKDDLAKYRIEYDVWFPESTLHAAGAVDEAIQKLTRAGATYQQDGAVWYKATEHGAEKDEVLRRANGLPTYFAADIAYHANKYERGFTTLIDAWGSDHHGHVARMKGVMEAMGYPAGSLDIVLFQFVNLVRDGQPVRMSKRTGKAITLTDLLEEVPIDSARFFFNMREPGSTIEFDLDLAVAQDNDNPVYYVQYAHARVCSILRNLAGEGVVFTPAAAFENLALLATDSERELIRRLGAFPGEVLSAAAGRDPARITRHAVEVATALHRFYTSCRIKGEAPALQQARLALAVAAGNVIKNALGILKVSAPESM